jgi:hypothetical protein
LVSKILLVDLLINHLVSFVNQLVLLEDSQPVVVEEEWLEMRVEEGFVDRGLECAPVAIEGEGFLGIGFSITRENRLSHLILLYSNKMAPSPLVCRRNYSPTRRALGKDSGTHLGLSSGGQCVSFIGVVSSCISV